MARRSKEVDKYLEGLEPQRNEALSTLRALVFEAIPDVKESMRYRMPTYELEGVVVAMASQKQYISLYMDVDAVAEHGDDLSHLNCGKSCVRFRRIEQVPLETIKSMLLETVERQRKDPTH